MGGQTWIAYTLAAVMIVTSVYCLSRLTVSWREKRPTERPVDAAHVLMGVAMAGMLVPRLRIFWTGGWEVVFGLGAVGFAWLAFRDMRTPVPECEAPRQHNLQHVLACGAMVYMLAAAPAAAAAGSGMSGMAGEAARLPTLALILAVALFGYVIWTADRLTSLAPVAALAAAGTPALVRAGGSAATDGQSAGLTESAGDGEARGSRPAPLSPRLAACCEIVMGVTMGYMLILML
jgi:cytochrome b561